MSETILCAKCGQRMAWEDAEEIVVVEGPAPWEAVDPENAPVKELVCQDCAKL